MQRDRQLTRAEVHTEVTTDLTDGIDDVLADLLRQDLQLLVREVVEVLRAVDAVEVAGGWAHEVRV